VQSVFGVAGRLDEWSVGPSLSVLVEIELAFSVCVGILTYALTILFCAAGVD
jgi:hypothetical protein